MGLAKFEDVEFVGWCDINPVNAEARRAQVGGQGKVYTDARQMLDEAKPDAVYIMLPPYAHGAAEALVVERRLPFFCEKPVAINTATAMKVAEGVEKYGLLTGVGYMNRYRQSVQRVKALLQDQKPVLMHGGWLSGGPDKFEGIWEWWVQKDKSGGQFFEQCTHTTDLARFLFGEVTHVYAVEMRGRKPRPAFFTMEDASMVQLKFASGAAANLYSSVSTAVGGGVSLTVFGTAMRADFTGWEHSVEISLPNGEKTSIPGEPNIFAKEDRAFIDFVKAGKNCGIMAQYADGLKIVAISEAANKSMVTGEVIAL